jgi:hypothetical protein
LIVGWMRARRRIGAVARRCFAAIKVSNRRIIALRGRGKGGAEYTACTSTCESMEGAALKRHAEDGR